MSQIFEKLTGIVGSDYASKSDEEMFIYSRDPGVQEPHAPDYVVLPRTTEEVRQIVLLANKEKIPVVPLGGGLTLSGITRPLKGGIVLDMKRMDQIVEVNEQGRYAVVEGGTSQGALVSYLEKHFPHLEHSVPAAPAATTIAGNCLIHGQGHLAQKSGCSSEMLTGLEVVLPTGEVCRVGFCSASPYWTSRAPLPDLVGLFAGWTGTTGVVTKLGVRLYPKPAYKDVTMFIMADPSLVPEVVFRITDTDMVEDVQVFGGNTPTWLKGLQTPMAYVTGNSEEEIEFKHRTIKKALREYEEKKLGGFYAQPRVMKQFLFQNPPRFATKQADFLKGAGFGYAGPIMPLGLYPQAYEAAMEVNDRYEMPSYGIHARVIEKGTAIMMTIGYIFRRQDPEFTGKVMRALHEVNEKTIALGAIPYKASQHAQELIMKRMDPVTLDLMKRVKKLLDPNGIMNPGNWEVK